MRCVSTLVETCVETSKSCTVSRTVSVPKTFTHLTHILTCRLTYFKSYVTENTFLSEVISLVSKSEYFRYP